MRVLVACEESQRVCTAFRERGRPQNKGRERRYRKLYTKRIDYTDYNYKLENGELKAIPKPRECPIEIDEDEISVKNTMDLWVKGTRRMFVNSKDIYAYFSKSKDESKFIICIDVRQAWGILSENLQEISKKYKVDFKIFATEQGMEFCQDVEVVNGEVVASNEITFDDFQWEAPDPRQGG